VDSLDRERNASGLYRVPDIGVYTDSKGMVELRILSFNRTFTKELATFIVSLDLFHLQTVSISSETTPVADAMG
jgi:hypothetical protein